MLTRRSVFVWILAVAGTWGLYFGAEPHEKVLIAIALLTITSILVVVGIGHISRLRENMFGKPPVEEARRTSERTCTGE